MKSLIGNLALKAVFIIGAIIALILWTILRTFQAIGTMGSNGTMALAIKLSSIAGIKQQEEVIS